MKKRFASADNMNGAYRLSVIIFCLIFGYAFLRYVILKGVSVNHVPLFINNKAISVSAVALISMAYLLGPLARFMPSLAPTLGLRKGLGLIGFSLASVHAVVSLLLFSPANYPKFFAASGELNLTGELSMLFGVLSLAVFALVAVTSIQAVERTIEKETWRRIQRTGYLALILVLLHVLVMGLEGWLAPQTWPGGLLPMSLVAFIFGGVVLLARVLIAFK